MPTLTSAPSLLPLYGRAAVTAPFQRFLGGGPDLPSTVYTLDGQTIAADHLAAYQRVCGFAVSDELPATYLHMLAFPLSMALMSERAFPFPVIGLVHVANRISVHRPVRSSDTVSLRVSAADLRPHPAGTQFDVLAAATIDGAEVWTSASTYLRRGKPSPDAPKREKRPDAPEPSGTASLVRVPGDIGRRYAAVSGDRNPIHLSGLSARLFGFPSAIAHGMWLKARTLAALEGRLPAAYDVEVAFKTPVLLPSTVALSADADGDGWDLDVRNAKSGKPHLTGTVRSR